MSGNFAIKGGGVGPLMANAILNFHCDFPHPSLICIFYKKILFYQTRPSLLLDLESAVMCSYLSFGLELDQWGILVHFLKENVSPSLSWEENSLILWVGMSFKDGTKAHEPGLVPTQPI